MNSFKFQLFFCSLLAFFLFNAKVFGQNDHSDTLFLQIDSIYGKAQSVYILKPGSVHYETDNYLKTTSDQEYVNFSHLEKQNITFEHFKMELPWTKWVPLEQYKGEYYTYQPCDGYFDYGILITDSSKVEWTGEGLYLGKTLAYQKIDESTYLIITTSSYSNMQTTIHIIDKKRGIAIFEMLPSDFAKENTEPFYTLVVAVDKIDLFPTIVNHCSIEKAREWVFDEVDFKALIRK